MSVDIVQRLQQIVRKTAITVCWRQWAALHPLVGLTSARPLTALIDPEALLLLSLHSHPRERRMTDLLVWWATVGASTLSVQRLRTLARHFPSTLQAEIAAFAAHACAAGDRRWGTLAGSRHPAWPLRPGKGHASIDWLTPPALMLRLRAGFGVGVKADLLTCLIGHHGTPVTIPTLARMLGYSAPALRLAARDMAAAQVIVPTATRPVAYSTPWRSWMTLLQPPHASAMPSESPPRWQSWARLCAWLSQLDAWATAQMSAPTNPIVMASQARDLFDRYTDALDQTDVVSPSPTTSRGAAFLPACVETLHALAQWFDAQL